MLRLLLSALLAVSPAVAPAVAPAAAEGGVYEAEDATLAGVFVATDTAGYSGSGYAAGFDDPADSVTFTVDGGDGGLFDLSIRYHSPYGQKYTRVLLNGTPNGEVALGGNDGFADAAAGRVLLGAGRNTIDLQDDWGYYEIDAITVTPAPPPPPHRITGTLTNPDATPEARSLIRYLTAHTGTDLLSGQQDAANIAWLEQNTGKAPAVGGFDLMDYSPSRVERGSSARTVEDALAWDARGGITTFVWHWNAPTGLIDTPGHEWWRGFYTDATTFDLAAALANPDGDDYKLILRDIDAIAVQLRRLADAHVPVLFRPLHEAEGGWFWWGAKGPGPAKALYRLLYDRLTETHHLNNLVWVWNSVSPDWYPGDDVVDIASYDSYPPEGDHGAVSGTYDALRTLVGDRKPVALAEVGSVPDPALVRAYRADWSYFVAWDTTSNDLDFLRRVYADPRVVTLDRVGNFKNLPLCTASLRLLSSWQTGYLAEVTVTSTGAAPVNAWQVGGITPPRPWNAEPDPAGARNASWNGHLAPGATTTFTYLGDSAAGPTPPLTCTAT